MADRSMSADASPETWPASRTEGLERLQAFLPHAGRAYAARRNYDHGVGRHTDVSRLSPYVRHRMVSECEIVRAVLASHTPGAAEKFIQEVCWRTYWKGWLEQHPTVWFDYLDAVELRRSELVDNIGLAADIARAEAGKTGIGCFDAWATELTSTGYMHNHARMWFASIWIFTLRLPWELGAHFFLRHLLDGDPASNTLSWRWVAGLHTRGKTYLARADNISKFTSERFQPSPDEFPAVAPTLRMDDRVHRRVPLRLLQRTPPDGRALLLVTEEDLSPEQWPIKADRVSGVIIAKPDVGPRFADHVTRFKSDALADAAARCRAHWQSTPTEATSAEEVIAAAAACEAEVVLTGGLPIGFLRSEIDTWEVPLKSAGLELCEITRPWDAEFWPHARAGFFQLKDRIPIALRSLGLV